MALIIKDIELHNQLQKKNLITKSNNALANKKSFRISPVSAPGSCIANWIKVLLKICVTRTRMENSVEKKHQIASREFIFLMTQSLYVKGEIQTVANIQTSIRINTELIWQRGKFQTKCKEQRYIVDQKMFWEIFKANCNFFHTCTPLNQM